MMDWTIAMLYLHRLFTPHALLYTEMISRRRSCAANAARLLEHDPREHPVALQLGGCDPEELAQRGFGIGASLGYDEINLNVGCPSDRVKSAPSARASLLNPELVASACAACAMPSRYP